MNLLEALATLDKAIEENISLRCNVAFYVNRAYPLVEVKEGLPPPDESLTSVRNWIADVFQHKTTPSNVALFDMDGSLFDYDSALIYSLNKMRHPSEPEIVGDLHQLEKADYLKARMDAIKSVPGWWKSLKPIENGLKIYQLAKEIGFECEILTKGPKKKSMAWMEKLQCCQEHFGENIDVHVVSKKGGYYGKILYDDFPEYMLSWLEHRPRGLGIMPVNDSNRSFQHPQVIKWDGTNYEEIRTAMQFVFERKPGEDLRLKE